MPLLKIKRSAQVTLPLELRRQFHLAEGDYMEAEARPEGILLKPVAGNRAALRELLAEGAKKHAARDLGLANEASHLEEEIYGGK